MKSSLRWAALTAVVLSLLAAFPAAAQEVTINLGEGGTFSGRIVQLILLTTVLALAPSIIVVLTSFTRIIVVLSLLRSAIGTQQTPPNVVLISLALFLTGFVMAPTFEKSYKEGIAPLVAEEIEQGEAFELAVAPFRVFMLGQVREQDLQLFFDLGKLTPPKTAVETPLHVLIPAFIISELRRAFEIGFLLFVPFVVIDLVVSSILMSMGMMMLPPVMISLPFKLIFFVLVDGWALVAGSLVKSFGV
ncbi:MAG: flagellar type III secretion system pore protein FliP [Sphingomonadales bacterium]|nr:flagellar type III secretion system pore protein FliP [Sphingomonadales bacterium]RIK95588.1 MAG: flagellar biosynthetic protein FliP [Pseudomonadota bacterium]